VRRIYFDTMIYAYWLEDHAALSERVRQIYDAMLRRGDTLCSSLFVLSELLVGPLKVQDTQAAKLIEQYFQSDAVTMLPYTFASVRIFARLRAQHEVRSLDALHLAIAATDRVDLFLTNDHRLQKLVVPGLPFIASLDTELFPKT
jgi:predicted nucleic acid-binding protein